MSLTSFAELEPQSPSVGWCRGFVSREHQAWSPAPQWRYLLYLLYRSQTGSCDLFCLTKHMCTLCEFVTFCQGLPTRALDRLVQFGRPSGGLFIFHLCAYVLLSGLHHALCLPFTRPVLVNRLKQERRRFWWAAHGSSTLFFEEHKLCLRLHLPPHPRLSLIFLLLFPFLLSCQWASDGRTQSHNAILLSPVAHFDKADSLSTSDGSGIVQCVCVCVRVWVCVCVFVCITVNLHW